MSGDVIQQAAEVLAQHQATTGMQVASGTTCRCGYWTGNERPGSTRPAGLQGLIWHQAQVLADAGLLPTEQAWGVQHPDLDVVLVLSRTGRPLASREEATAHAQQFADGPATVVTRRFTPWKDAP